jgi:transcriptional regulator with XRE-family HTH domain
VRDVGRRIAELRQDAGLTQQEFAERLEMSGQYLRRVEAGEVNLSVRSLVKFAQAIRVEVEELFALPRDRKRPGRGRPPKPTAGRGA